MPRVALKLAILPVLFYLAVFVALTFPLVRQFSTHLFADQGDGLQGVWNLWWINKAVTELHQWPWTTRFLHYPEGTSLIGHNLMVLDGLIGIVLLRAFSLIQTHNLIVVFCFTAGGFTAFLLAHHLTGSYLGSLVAGFVFTFSSFHFSHAEGHLHQVSIEFIPLFVLLWYRLVLHPSLPLAAGAAAALVAVLLSDYYFFVYCVVIAGVVLVWHAIRARTLLPLTKQHAGPLMLFGAIALAFAGPVVGSLLLLNRSDPLLGAHDPAEFSLDLLAPFIPGGHWRFAQLTRAFWSRLPGNVHESSLHLGISVWALMVYAWVRRQAIADRALGLSTALLLLFTVLSLGPVFHVAGRPIPSIPMPYAWAEMVFPPLKLSGCPGRMMIVGYLAAGLICALAVRQLLTSRRGTLAAAALLALVVVEYLPSSMPASQIDIPDYVRELRDTPFDGAVVDLNPSPPLALYYQTIHEKPMGFGYLARLPRSVAMRDALLDMALVGPDYARLYDVFRVRCIVRDGRPQWISR